MAKLASILKIEGTIDDLTFYKSSGRFLVRKKGGVSRERFTSDKSFERCRENVREFVQVAKFSKYLYDSFRMMLRGSSDNRSFIRLRSVVSNLKNMDTTSVRGDRMAKLVLKDKLGFDLLRGFDFNERAKMSSVLFRRIDLQDGGLKVEFKEFRPSEELSFGDGSTHFSMVYSKCVLDLDSERSEMVSSEVFRGSLRDEKMYILLKLSGTTSLTGIDVYFLRIDFYQELNGIDYSMKNGAYNSCKNSRGFINSIVF